MPEQPALPANSSTGLTAILVYRRPADRRELLGQIADLGIFVVEHPRPSGCGAVAATTGADVAVVIAAGPGDAPLVAELAGKQGRPVLVCLPDGADPSAHIAAGAHRCVSDHEFVASAPRLIAETAAAARTLRESAMRKGDFHFAGVTFQSRVPSIAAHGRTRVLSRSESAVLQRLFDAGGYPVEAEELERFATPAGTSMKPGFLKATVLRLRRKLNALGADPDAIRTVRGIGYALWMEGNSP